MKVLLEFLLDITDIYTIYSLYVGLFLGLTIKLFIIWALKDANVELLSKKITYSIPLSDYQIQKKSRIAPKEIILWIIKYIRSRSGTGDDPDSVMIF